MFLDDVVLKICLGLEIPVPMRIPVPLRKLELRTTNLQWGYLTYCPVRIYLLKVNNRNTRTRYEICSKLTINSVSIVNFVHVITDWVCHITQWIR